LGRVLTRSEILRVLQTRLRLQRAWQTTPAITAQTIDAPLFVVGPPRTGTTILLELLALDPQLRAPIAYEALYPLASMAVTCRSKVSVQPDQSLSPTSDSPVVVRATASSSAASRPAT